MKKIYAVLIISALIFTDLYSQNLSFEQTQSDTINFSLEIGNNKILVLMNLYPLEVGNVWVYMDTSWWPTIQVSRVLIEVLGDSVAPNGKLYFHLKEGSDHFLERIDSTEGILYRYFEHPNLPEDEYIIADLLAEMGDTILVFDPNNPNIKTYLFVSKIDTFYKWGLTKFRKEFCRFSWSYSMYRIFSFTNDIGLDFSYWGLQGTQMSLKRRIKGCIISGIVYGDPSPVDEETQKAPLEFTLLQNYPNPFNPATTINFEIPEREFVTLKVYDILGREFATLVDEEKPAGSYEVQFSASGLTSGIYFYQFQAGNYSETKKMILLK